MQTSLLCSQLSDTFHRFQCDKIFFSLFWGGAIIKTRDWRHSLGKYTMKNNI